MSVLMLCRKANCTRNLAAGSYGPAAYRAIRIKYINGASPLQERLLF